MTTFASGFSIPFVTSRPCLRRIENSGRDPFQNLMPGGVADLSSDVPLNDPNPLTPRPQEAIRLQAVEMFSKGIPAREVAKKLEVSKASVYNWVKRHRARGKPALRTKSRTGRPRKLDKQTLEWIADVVANRNPLEMGFPRALWNREIIAALVGLEWGANLSRRTVQRVLEKLGLVPKRRNIRAWMVDVDGDQRWLNFQILPLKAYARRIKARICFADATDIRRGCPVGKDRELQEEEAPPCGDKETGCSMLSALSPSGAVSFMIAERKIRSAHFCAFLDRLMTGEDRRVIMIAPNRPAFRSHATVEHLKSFNGRLLLYVIPRHDAAPNPLDYAWNWTKAQKIDDH